MSSWSRALVWSLIAAAFIGPGTVTTAARAGTEGGWYYGCFLLLAAVAGYLLMEMAARLTLVSGQTLGQILGSRGKGLAIACFLAVLLGCVAYQAGNLLGALGGMQLIVGGTRWWLLALAFPAFVVLWTGDTKKISGLLAVIVGLMGLVFVVVAIGLLFGSASLTGQGKVETNTIVALIGTTIVPYNFFLAAGLSQGQVLGDMRRGLLISFAVGTLITLSIVLVGSSASVFTNFTDLARTLDTSLWGKGNEVLGVGLFAAGFSSAVTAPLAASLAGRELLGGMLKTDFGSQSIIFRIIWGVVLGFGLFVALLELDIITVILAAQV
ncbi:MAG: divalent metal cation transporter, partial [Bacteroidota bacterium]